MNVNLSIYFGFTHYKSVEDTGVVLTQPLGASDTIIYVNDTSTLTIPNPADNKPGVIFLDKERIEYFEIDGNTLTRLRRGTLGTGVKEEYDAGTEVYDQGPSKNLVNYDSINRFEATGDGITTDFQVPFEVGDINELSIFVAGIPVTTSSQTVHDSTLAFDSPDGDVVAPPDAILDGNTVTFATAPAQNLNVLIIKKTGSV